MDLKELRGRRFESKKYDDYSTCIEYFRENSCKEVGYQAKYKDLPIVSPAKGIYKNKDMDIAVSVKQTLKSPYADIKPVYFEDGTGIYLHHQQGNDSKNDRDTISENKALYNNVINHMPVGILIQTKEKCREGARYKCHIGIPIGWVEGVFIIAIANEEGEICTINQNMSISEYMTYALEQNEMIRLEELEAMDVNVNVALNRRKKEIRKIVRRRSERDFREKLLRLYNYTCPITGCNVEEALETSVISTYTTDNSIYNGIVLRSDINQLWIKGYVSINPDDMTVHFNRKLIYENKRSIALYCEYEHLDGKKINMPMENKCERFLYYHFRFCC